MVELVGISSLNYQNLVKVLASFEIFEEKGETSDELKSALEVLEYDITPEDIVRAEKNILITSFGILMSVIASFVFLKLNPFLPLILTAILPLALTHLLSEYPKIRAKEKVLNSISKAPEVVSILAASLKQNPNLEEAVKFLTKEESSLIIRDFKDALKKCWLGEEESLEDQLTAIGYKWGRYLPGFKRSLYLIRSALSEKREDKRNDLLDKAIERTLNSVDREVENFASNLSTPTMILFSFGTVIPLALISLFPIITFLGQGFSSLEISILLGLILLGSYIYSNSVLRKRPTAFPPPEVTSKKHVELLGKDMGIRPILYAISLAFLISIPGIFFLVGELPLLKFNGMLYTLLKGVNTLTVIWGAGIGLSIYNYTRFKGVSEAREEVKELEETILDGLYQLANKIDLNKSIEASVREISNVMSRTVTGELFRKISEKMRSGKTLVTSVRKVTEDVKSKTTRSLFNFFLRAYERGSKSAAQALFTITEYFEKTRETEEKMKNRLSKSLSMMELSATFLIPMVTGLTVTLQKLLQKGIEKVKEKMVNTSPLGIEIFSFQGISPAILQLVLGFYMLVITALLIRYCVYIRNGEDKVKLGLEMSKKVPIALLVFSATLILSRYLLL